MKGPKIVEKINLIIVKNVKAIEKIASFSAPNLLLMYKLSISIKIIQEIIIHTDV